MSSAQAGQTTYRQDDNAPDKAAPRAAAAQDGIAALDALTLVQAIHAGEVSCVEVMDACLDRIQALNPVHNALVALEDSQHLRDQARAADAALRSGQPVGVLHGVPQAPKDIMPVRGMRTTKGCVLFQDHVPQEDAVAFARMRREGAIFVGRSNTPEFGLGGHTYNAVYGITRNAHDPALSAGGSSGGAAVAVASGMLPVADGSDMMGSLRTPAAFNGIFGLRTTPGLIPHGAANPDVAPALSVCGPMARNVPDLALMLSALADFPAQLPFRRSTRTQDYLTPLQRDLRGVRVGWLGDLDGHLPMQPGVLEDCIAALSQFGDTGCRIEPVTPAFDLDALWQAWIDLRSFQFYRSNAPVLEDPASFARIKPEAQWEFQRGRQLSAERVAQATQVRRQWQACVQDLFGRFDYLLLPSAQVYPFAAESHWPATVGRADMDTYHRWMQAVIAATMAAVPALSVPAGQARGARAVGIQILAPAHGELAAMQLAHAYDQARCGAG